MLVTSFGGPRSPQEVVPFLKRVSNGRIPEERLSEVAHHYDRFGGVSPINASTDAFVKALANALRQYGVRIPILLGNRNGSPFLDDVLPEMHQHGVRRVLAVVTSAYACYSGCRQYREEIAAALDKVGITDMHIDKVPPFNEAPGFIRANAEALMQSFMRIPPTPLEATRVVFVTHSIPDPMQEASGAGEPGTDYISQHKAVCEKIADYVRQAFGNMPQWDLAYCSRSGRPSDPWLEPDINDHLRTLPEQGVTSVVVAPIGFVADHMEVANDLDHEAAETAAEVGLAFARAATAGVHPAFITDLAGLIMTQAAAARGEGGSLTSWPTPCAPGCCRRCPGATDIPAVSGSDDIDKPEIDPKPAAAGLGTAAAGVEPESDASSPYDLLAKEIPMTDHVSTDSVAEGPRDDEAPAGSYTAPTDPRDHAVVPEEVNASSKWAMYSVFRVSAPLPADDAERRQLIEGSDGWVEQSGVETRGWYDLSGMRADADLLVWWLSDDPSTLQDAYHRFRGSGLGRHLAPVWSNVGVHRAAEFNKSHLPSCFAGVAPRRWAAFYPFIRSKEWYLLPAADRSRMLREHGMVGAASPDVKASTLAAFALGDYEWILALEGDDLVRVVDVMKDLRYVEARRYVDLDTPFFTGERVSPMDWADRQMRS
ncbi:hydrogen peroxide-dependent heme synthase [Cutibacterium sp.]|uniref:hydrogen peroxide-dependent heme synthase n=1 Tax=Cutibacterium sp. TaxID=1912221 RepID=UPI0026DC446A|nr:hydrogen peroxide-dependent heme synthase [Cutibacterium sp.]MDO4412795.1 ferrochelatase [Cutibacterium sp.]